MELVCQCANCESSTLCSSRRPGPLKGGSPTRPDASSSARQSHVFRLQCLSFCWPSRPTIEAAALDAALLTGNGSSNRCPALSWGPAGVDKHSGNESFVVPTFGTGIADCHCVALSYEKLNAGPGRTVATKWISARNGSNEVSMVGFGDSDADPAVSGYE